jgi:hypothetical protein
MMVQSLGPANPLLKGWLTNEVGADSGTTAKERLPQLCRFFGQDTGGNRPFSGGRSSMVMQSRNPVLRNITVWIIEFIKLVARRRVHPMNAECPICQQMVRLHYRKAGRRHVLAHARACSRALYEGSRYAVHHTAKLRCIGSGALAKFDPRPNEKQYFNTPRSLEPEGF